MEKLLSVIIPIYNGENYIETLVNSIENYNQEIAEQIELILVDDGSKDDSLGVSKILSQKYANIVILSKANEGIAATREYGVNHSTGRFITFCDQDDIVLRGYSTFIKNMEDNDCEMLMANYQMSGNNNEINEFIHNDAVYEAPEIKLILAHLLNHELVDEKTFKEKGLPDVFCSVWNCIFSRNVILKNNIHFMKFVDFEDDWIYIVSMLANISRLYVSKDSYYCWNVNPASESHTYKFIPDYFNKREKLLEWACGKLHKLNLGEGKETMFMRTFKAQTIIRGFYMFCGLKYSLYKHEIEKVCQFGNLSQYKGTTFLGGQRKYLRFLLNHRLYLMAYFLNNYILNRVLR